MRMDVAATSAVAAITCAACVASSAQQTITAQSRTPDRAAISQLWIDPGATPRDLFWGVGGRGGAPDPDATYRMLAMDRTGFSVSFDIEGPDEVEWSAKIGPEAQTEVVVSRLLWGLGYHQPPVYYLPSWTLDRGRQGRRRESEARFRPKLPDLVRADDPWRWDDNPFLGTRELRGLLVVLLMLNSTDLKDENNSIYEVMGRGRPARWFLVRDLGAALGETGKLYPRRNWLEGFERSGFITAVSERGVEFAYGGRHRGLIETIRPEDVRWAARRLSRLTERQWRDAFRAGNYDAATTGRYLAVIRQRVADGLVPRADRFPPAARHG
jgi:hypothetical protein